MGAWSSAEVEVRAIGRHLCGNKSVPVGISLDPSKLDQLAMLVECVGLAFEVPGTPIEVLGMGVRLTYLGVFQNVLKRCLGVVNRKQEIMALMGKWLLVVFFGAKFSGIIGSKYASILTSGMGIWLLDVLQKVLEVYFPNSPKTYFVSKLEVRNGLRVRFWKDLGVIMFLPL
ncbi:hypothetical protein PanWU01x14_158250 [Parasponia andersonii]|uniref:Uncharacterized protein n=1 Tax=Parasponia andersonii TaxID=3476 RepID=A0A2P5CEY1_PARAD|nr:hypothetical protein PanWU01x14_158250 [Parasponia andersonii]